MSELRSRRPFGGNRRIAVPLLWVAFAVGCVLGAAFATGITETALQRLRESMDQYVTASVAGQLRQSLGACVLDFVPWTFASLVMAAFVSAGVTLPLILGLRGGILGYLAAAMFRLYGWPNGLYWLGALCGVKNVMLLLSMATAIVPNFTRTLQRVRNRGSKHIYALDRTYLCSAAASLVAMLAGAVADLYLTPVLITWLAR